MSLEDNIAALTAAIDKLTAAVLTAPPVPAEVTDKPVDPPRARGRAAAASPTSGADTGSAASGTSTKAAAGDGPVDRDPMRNEALALSILPNGGNDRLHELIVKHGATPEGAKVGDCRLSMVADADVAAFTADIVASIAELKGSMVD